MTDDDTQRRAINIDHWDGDRAPRSTNSRNSPSSAAAHPDAERDVTDPPPVRDRQRDTLIDTVCAPIDDLVDSVGLLPNVTPRDARAIGYLVLLRLLGYDQLRRLAFDTGDPSILRRRANELEAAGWLTRWTAHLPNGRRIRCALPTSYALREVSARLDAAVDGLPFAPLVRRMLPRTGRRPLKLDGNEPPNWFAHQREVNHLVASIVRSGRRILWASSWDCPFPAIAENYTLPQPDYVLVEEVPGTARLRVVFGEHDRGTDDVGRFVERKLELYDELADSAVDAKALFGVADFIVHVTVMHRGGSNPIGRLHHLLEEASATANPDIFRFTLGGWLHAYPAERVWFSASHPPHHRSRHYQDHESLVGA